MIRRTQEEILHRVDQHAAAGEDAFGFRRDLLIDALDIDHARPFLQPDITGQQWDNLRWDSLGGPEAYGREYLWFTVRQILHHRSGSASRAVDKLTELAWLLGRDDVVTAMNTAPYPMYGAPKITAFADGLGWPLHSPAQDPDWRDAFTRMAAGQPCNPDGCVWGCQD
ncbi:hypothetical protein ACFFMR_29225 [Micromonospora andamanensis]|uniref:Uncharacterized protein n=1 Tax=Micromonospora andamanensis TaxID=1287068 RepID=A0ABQ4HRZ6_9ACTN|nr:hypothetical protein [Micromonospora andamanensis]GIJ08429.1 hypothetical protein Van01_16430 [Micromonospora andamanensis]